MLKTKLQREILAAVLVTVLFTAFTFFGSLAIGYEVERATIATTAVFIMASITFSFNIVTKWKNWKE